MPLIAIHRSAASGGREGTRALAAAVVAAFAREHAPCGLEAQLAEVTMVTVTTAAPGEFLLGLGPDAEAPAYRLDVDVPAGSRRPGSEDALVRALTDAVLEAGAAPGLTAGRVWVVVREAPEGAIAVGGERMRLRAIVARLARMRRSGRDPRGGGAPA